jgi:DNA repair protein RadC
MARRRCRTPNCWRSFCASDVRGKSAVDLARELLASFRWRPRRLAAATTRELARLPGIGPGQSRPTRRIPGTGTSCARRTAQTKGCPGFAGGSSRLAAPFGWAACQHEVFVALWLDAQNRLIASEELFRGTLTQTSVYPREVVKRALAHNAGAVILAHNHPSGLAEPSRADEVLTSSLKQALALIDVKAARPFHRRRRRKAPFLRRARIDLKRIEFCGKCLVN